MRSSIPASGTVPGPEAGAAVLAPAEARSGGSRPVSVLGILLRRRAALLGVAFILGVAALAILGPLMSRYDPRRVDPGRRLQPPSAGHWLGTDDLGRDVLTRALYGARVSFAVGAAVTVVTAAGGAVLGLASAYYARLDPVVMRVMDGLLAFPSILLAIAIMASLGPSTANVILALAAVYVAPTTRLVRGATLVTRQLPYVESALTLGASDCRIMGRHILPNVLTPIVVQCTFTIAFAIISEASLSFLGAGVPPEIPTWGNMLRDGQRLLSRAWWISVFPGSGLFLTVLAFNLLGDAFRDALDPRARTLVTGIARRGSA
jgi:peptide/nickel transport system permease protein